MASTLQPITVRLQMTQDPEIPPPDGEQPHNLTLDLTAHKDHVLATIGREIKAITRDDCLVWCNVQANSRAEQGDVMRKLADLISPPL